MSQQLFISEVMHTSWQLYGVVNGQLKAIDGYAKRIDEYNQNLFDCIGVGEFIWIDFDNGQLSVWLESFLKKQENQKYANQFFPRRKK